MNGIKKTITIVGVILLLIGIYFLGKKANEKDTENRIQEHNQKEAAKTQNEPKITFSLGSVQNPIQMEKIISKWRGEYYINPGDSLWFMVGDPRITGWKTKFTEFSGGKFHLYREFDKKPLIETPKDPIPDSRMVGVNTFCIKNVGSGIVVLYSWWGHKSARDIAKLGTSN